MLNDPVIFSAYLWEFILVGVLLITVGIMAIVYIRKLEKRREADRAAAIRVGLLLQQNRELLGRVREQIIRDDRYIKDLEKDRHNLTLQVCELKSRVNYYENNTREMVVHYD